ncbi:hypothetical protein KVR01_011527 [Diaporthe batatas]|uniref:uncharacterized protein n=1 Tax=Diaporthe batatas TaxID=748121 RepID=UPI001D05AC7C|nr:uncharacterized protein KVR01_011527 [Diaporthe batatas]KAG8158405.1 hypothetical protein KVR01_011527 [Diaporthe batatas]
MAKFESRAARAALATPFVVLAVACLSAMDTNKLIAQQQPFLQAGSIEFEDGSMPLFDNFYWLSFLDEMWRGITVTFSNSYLPLDTIGWWQLFSFLHDLGPMYSVWFLESCRAGNVRTPVYAVTLFTFIAQLLGVGNVAPMYYFLHVTFAPSATSLKRSAKQRLRAEKASFLLPLFLALHTFQVIRAFTAPEPETRQYWVWAWQMSPLWLGVANSLLCSMAAGLVKNNILASPRFLLVCMCTISSAIWVYTWYSAPFSMSDIFIPDAGVYTDFIRHTRKAMQCDEVYSFGSSFLWLLYMFFDMYVAGLIGIGSLAASACLPLMVVVTGPGSAFALGWYWREHVLSSH